MDELLSHVLDAHGGVGNWSTVATVTARLSLGGPFWGWRGWPGVYQGQTVTIDAHREHITFTPFTGPDRTSVLDVDPQQVTPERVQILAGDGRVLEQRENPRASFPVVDDTVAWDAVQVAYFTSAATWNYLTAPFVFTYPGVEAHEIRPWHEDGQTWRRLAVTFPPSIANHNPDQVFYYDENFLQRRMDYSPEVTGSQVAHYTHDSKTFDGFVFYTRRLVHLHATDGVADQSFAPITIDVDSVSVQRQ